MASDLYNQINSNDFIRRLNELKSQGGDPNAMIQNLLSTGRISQAQLNSAMQKAQQIMQMLPTSVRR